MLMRRIPYSFPSPLHFRAHSMPMLDQPDEFRIAMQELMRDDAAGQLAGEYNKRITMQHDAIQYNTIMCNATLMPIV